jgi:tetratricopeptide (TPR) repeat protein
MGKNLVEKLLAALPKMKWPETPGPTSLGHRTYEFGLEKVAEYKGDPTVLGAALRVFQSGDSRPYAYAGIAYTLLVAAREPDDSFAQEGLEASMSWLEEAQEMAPDQVEINMIEALIYIYSGRYDDARLILDYLERINPNDFYVLSAEIAFWERQGDLAEAIDWYEKAINAADTVPRKLRLRSQMGDCFLRFGRPEKALEIYQEAVHFSQENPWLWHHMGLAYWELEDYKNAHRYNRRALDLLDFQEARELESALKQKLGTGGLASRLLGR